MIARIFEAIIIAALLCALTYAAMAHGWYPFSCCGDQDCKPVPCEELVEDKNGWRYIVTGNHFEANQVLPSQDRYCHVCLGMSDKRSLCAFIVSGT